MLAASVTGQTTRIIMRVLLTWTARLPLPISWGRLAVLNTRTHTVHRLSLLGTLMCHHRSCWPPWTRVAVSTRRPLRWSTRWHEVRVARVHHLRYALRTGYKLRAHHHRAPHLTLLWSHELLTIREAPVLSHLRSASRAHVNGLVIRHLSWRAHARVTSHCYLAQARGGK